ncbi:MAG: hypothetical protein DMF62_10780 [Acidobacteria bacterium]|nr:MAG: hypothetical protein DMF62_10780 [Acidobacteriota bacterium]
MKFWRASQLFGTRDLRNAAVGSVVVFGGLLLAGITIFAHSMGDTRIAGIAAIASLVFVLLILIFVVPPLARNASREASQMNLPFEFTAGGAMMLGLAAIVGFSAWNTGNNLLFLILSFIFAAVVIAFFAGGYTLKKLDVKMRFPETIFAGEETHIFVSLTNRKLFLPSYSVVAEVRGKEREESVAAEQIREILPRFVADRLTRPPLMRRTLDHFVRIPRNETVETRTAHVFPSRGRFLIKDFEISTKFPFGFFRHRRRLPARETELIVFPKFDPITHALDDLSLETGRLEATRRGLGQDLYAMREYRPNDDLRRVDWKATARSTQLTVREFSAEDDKRINIFLDTRMPSSIRDDLNLRDVIEAEQKGTNLVRPERFENGVSMVAALLSCFAKEQVEMRLIIDGVAGESGVGSRHLHDSLKRLAVVEPQFVDDMSRELPNLLAELAEKDEKSHNFLITAASEAEIDPEIIRNAQVISM